MNTTTDYDKQATEFLNWHVIRIGIRARARTITGRETMKRYTVEKRLGTGPWQYSATYKTKERAEVAVKFWKGQRGAVNNEPFDARIKERGEDATPALVAPTTRGYEVVESRAWQHKTTGQRASIHGACPWTAQSPGNSRDDWEIIVTGWTVYNPYTGEYGIGRAPWKTREEAEEWAKGKRPSRIGIGD